MHDVSWSLCTSSSAAAAAAVVGAAESVAAVQQLNLTRPVVPMVPEWQNESMGVLLLAVV